MNAGLDGETVCDFSVYWSVGSIVGLDGETICDFDVCWASICRCDCSFPIWALKTCGLFFLYGLSFAKLFC